MHQSLQILLTLRPLVAPSLHSGTIASGLRVYKICRLLDACVLLLFICLTLYLQLCICQGIFMFTTVLLLIVIPWARVVCLIYTPEAQGCIYQANNECPWYDYYVILPCTNRAWANTKQLKPDS